MKMIAVLAFVALAAAQYGPNAAGQTFLVTPQRTLRSSTWRSSLPSTKVIRSLTSKSSRSLPLARIARSWVPRVYRSSCQGPCLRRTRSWATHPGMSTEHIQNKEFTEQRVLRTPISKTMTVLPNEVTRITRNIKTHMPMVHERVKNFYNIEDINKKKIVHHFVEPVQNKHLGTRQGRAFKQGTEHRLENRPYQPRNFVNGAQEIGDGDVDVDESDLLHDAHWEVLQQETCQSAATGTLIRPNCVCVCKGNSVCGDSSCSQRDYPADIMC